MRVSGRSGFGSHNRWDNGVKRVYSKSRQGRNVSSIYSATAVLLLQHLKYILVLELAVGVLEQKKEKIACDNETCPTECMGLV